KDIKEIANDDNIPIIVGGTGFYLQALLDGYSLGGDTFDQLSIERRKKWQLFMEKNGKERLWEELAKLDIVAARKIPINNSRRDRKSTRLNSSHVSISYAVFCLKKKKK